jgi:hypothetical protein
MDQGAYFRKIMVSKKKIRSDRRSRSRSDIRVCIHTLSCRHTNNLHHAHQAKDTEPNVPKPSSLPCQEDRSKKPLHFGMVDSLNG